MTAVSTKGETGGIVFTYFMLKYSQLTSVVIASGIQQSYTDTCICSFSNSFPLGLLHNTAQSFLCYTVGGCQLSILSIRMYVSPKFSHHPFLPPKGDVVDADTHMGECHEAAKERGPAQTFFLKSSRGANQANTQMLDFFPPKH